VVVWAVFYIIIFSILAVLLVVGGIMARNRQRQRWAGEESGTGGHHPDRHNTKAKRAQSRKARRKRH
jgi:hypothetical protein